MPKKPENARKLANRHEKVNVKREPSREFLICVFAFAEAKKSGCHTGRYQEKSVSLSKITLLLLKISLLFWKITLIGEIKNQFLRMSSDFFRPKMTFFRNEPVANHDLDFANSREFWGRVLDVSNSRES